VGNGATAETEAPAPRRKPPATATPSTYRHRARRRLYPIRHLSKLGCQVAGEGTAYTRGPPGACTDDRRLSVKVAWHKASGRCRSPLILASRTLGLCSAAGQQGTGNPRRYPQARGSCLLRSRHTGPACCLLYLSTGILRIRSSVLTKGVALRLSSRREEVPW
jgi:hypothetical protein